MAEEEVQQPFTPTLTEARMPSVDHMFNQGMLNFVLDRNLGGPPEGVPRERPGIGLFSNLVRLVDKALREWDAARFELIDYIDGRDGSVRKSGVRTSPYIRAVDHMENVISAVARAVLCHDQLQALGFGRQAPRIAPTLREDIVRMRDMIEHADERLTKESVKASRPQFTDKEPYALRLENDWAWLGGWIIEYTDIVAVLTNLYEFIELLRGAKAAGVDHPQAVMRTTVTYIGDPPAAPVAGMMASDYLWEASRHSVSH